MAVSISSSGRLVGAILVTIAGAAPALGDDLIPPPWARFGPGTTAQSWDFHAGPNGGAPDGGLAFNPFGTPLFTPSNQGNWLPSLNGRNDVWAVNDFDPLNFTIPNDGPVPGDVKDMWLQVTYATLSVLGFNLTTNSVFGSATPVGSQTITSLPNGWTHQAGLWRFHGCPDVETLTITPPVFGTVIWVDQVVVDTYCYAPAPGVLGVGAAGLLLAGGRRRR